MALLRATGTFNIGTGALGTTVDVTTTDPDHGTFQPKVVVFWWSGRTAVGQGEGNHKCGWGYMVGAADRGGVTSQSQHAAASSVTHASIFDDAAIKLLTTAGVVDGAADFDSWLATGARLIIDDVFTADYLIHYLALGGTDLTDVASVTVAQPAATGDQNVTTIGFRPDCALFFVGPGGLAMNGIGTGDAICFGAAAGRTPVSALMAGNSQQAQATMDTIGYCRAGECIAVAVGAPGSVIRRASLTGWLADGFRLTWAEVTSTLNLRALCLKGGQYALGDALTSTGTTNQTEATPFQPKALLVVSHGKAESTVDTIQDHEEFSLGAAVSPTQRHYVSIIDKDAVADSDIGVADGTDAMYGNQSTDAAIVTEGLMDLVSFNGPPSPGFDYVMDDADPVAAFFWYLAIGDAPYRVMFRGA